MAAQALPNEDRTDVCLKERGTILLTEEGKGTEQESEAAPDYHRANFIILKSRIISITLEYSSHED